MDSQPRRLLRSRLPALVWFFRKSRDGWRKKCRTVRQMLRSCRVELRDVRRSREKWRDQAEALKAENRALRDQLDCERPTRSAPTSPPALRRAIVKAR